MKRAFDLELARRGTRGCAELLHDDNGAAEIVSFVAHLQRIFSPSTDHS